MKTTFILFGLLYVLSDCAAPIQRKVASKDMAEIRLFVSGKLTMEWADCTGDSCRFDSESPLEMLGQDGAVVCYTASPEAARQLFAKMVKSANEAADGNTDLSHYSLAPIQETDAKMTVNFAWSLDSKKDADHHLSHNPKYVVRFTMVPCSN